MESKLKAQAMDQAGEIYENLLLRESGYPHLPDPVFIPVPKSDAWNDASTNPTEKKVYQTKVGRDEIFAFQYWDGEKWCFACGTENQALNCKGFSENGLTTRKWREVQQ